jgi:hypothetical protein
LQVTATLFCIYFFENKKGSSKRSLLRGGRAETQTHGERALILFGAHPLKRVGIKYLEGAPEY